MRKNQNGSGIIIIVGQKRDALKIAHLDQGKRTEKRSFYKRFRPKNQNFRLVSAPQAPAGCSGRLKRNAQNDARTATANKKASFFTTVLANNCDNTGDLLPPIIPYKSALYSSIIS